MNITSLIKRCQMLQNARAGTIRLVIIPDAFSENVCCILSIFIEKGAFLVDGMDIQGEA